MPNPWLSVPLEEYEGHFRLLEPELLAELLTQQGFHLEEHRVWPLAGGKAFWAGVFRTDQR